ncbi:MAG TPA: alkaline phosphatase family protein [Candidatus Dormibacteraeota bacterium]|jgi:phospholipase C|nr:alkaline phosphatase family protein [Candidatus Dormibacteraeota bacterium]
MTHAPLRPSRRDVLKAGLGAGAAITAWQRASLLEALAACPTGGKLTDIQHVVIFIQENRSFDNYFGRYKGVRGFDDRSAPGGAAAFAQRVGDPATKLPDPLLPFHISTQLGPPHQGECTNDVEHQWAGAHDAWNGGRNDRWMKSHLATEATPRQAALTMGYYDRSDLQFYYPLADNFTICDNYFCSVIGGTDVNRLYAMTGTIDPDGWDGGLQFLNTKLGTIQNPGADLGTGKRWVPYPEVLQKAGVSWKVYGSPDGQAGDNVLRYFPQYRPVGGDSTLFASAFASNAFPGDFLADCQAGTLPQVSWIVSGLADTEHPPDPLVWGESITHTVLSALATSGLWKNSALFFTYDENGGFFDHVTPPTAPAGTPGEYLNQAKLTAAARADATTVKGVDLSDGPIGLGYRVPMLVISPFTRNPDPSGGPLVSSDLFDHTSMLRFLETWTTAIGKPAHVPDRNQAAQTPGLSAWRRRLVGDMTSAFNFAATPDASIPTALLSNVPNRADPRVLDQCFTTGTLGTLGGSTTAPIVQDPIVDANTAPPHQEQSPGRVRRPAQTCEEADRQDTVGGSGGSGGQDARLVDAAVGPATIALPNTAAPVGGGSVALLAATAVVGGLVRLRMRGDRAKPAGD